MRLNAIPKENATENTTYHGPHLIKYTERGPLSRWPNHTIIKSTFPENIDVNLPLQNYQTQSRTLTQLAPIKFKKIDEE